VVKIARAEQSISHETIHDLFCGRVGHGPWGLFWQRHPLFQLKCCPVIANCDVRDRSNLHGVHSVRSQASQPRAVRVCAGRGEPIAVADGPTPRGQFLW